MSQKRDIKNIIGIDVGGSSTKIVGFRIHPDGRKEMIPPQFTHAADPITSIYGAFGHFTLETGMALSDIDKVMITGVGSTFLQKPIYDLDCAHVSEFECVGQGGLYLSGLDEAIVISMGTGTALIHAKHIPGKEPSIEYMGGTGIGGGTLIGLCKKLSGVDTIDHIEQLCKEGDLSKIDLRVKDITANHHESASMLNGDLTAANFGKLSDLATSSDLAMGVANLVGESILMLAVFAARSKHVENVVLTGNLTAISAIRNVFITNADTFGVRFLIPELSQFGPVIGAALVGASEFCKNN